MNISLPLLIVAMTSVFLIGLLVQSFTRLRFCAVCVAVSGTWLTLLGARFAGYAIDPAIVGVLMGESIVGVYYLLEKKAPVGWQIFRWPFLITATALVYLILGISAAYNLTLLLLFLLWVIFAGIYACREYPAFKKIAERVIACCRDW